MLPTRKPDIDNVLKVILDSLNGVAYIDDSKVVEVIGRKRYATVPKVVV
jgi:Holliday junction resolvase RusA-like endonuclease